MNPPSPLLRRAALCYVWVVRTALVLLALFILYMLVVAVSELPDIAIIVKVTTVTLGILGAVIMYDAAKRII